MRDPDQKKSKRLRFRNRKGELVRYLAPQSKVELQYLAELYFGVRWPSKAVCPNHHAPLDAAWAAYSGEEPVIIILGSRAFGGKSTLLSTIALFELLDGMNVVVLGGSSAQSQSVHEHQEASWNHIVSYQGHEFEAPFRDLIDGEPGVKQTRMKTGNWIRAIPASTTSVRGPHPHRLRLDEVDEMDWGVYRAAMGQTLSLDTDFIAQTALASTLQYPDGTMMRLLMEEAPNKKWPVFEWCYRETHQDNGGHIPEREVRRKRSEMTEIDWEIEVELQQPNIEDRLFHADVLSMLFSDHLGEHNDKDGIEYTLEEPVLDGRYCTGADWGRSSNWTVIVTARIDVKPFRIVAYTKFRQLPWPTMTAKLEKRVALYGGVARHDSWGVGQAAVDLIHDPRIIGFDASNSKSRTGIYTDYIVAIEQGDYQFPKIRSIVDAHRNCRKLDLFGSRSQGHPPDAIAALALAHMAYTNNDAVVLKKRPGKLHKVRTW